MIFFTFPEYAHLVRPLRDQFTLEEGQFEIGRFENGELWIGLATPVSVAHCVIVDSLAPPDEQVLSFTLLAHTLEKEGADKITGSPAVSRLFPPGQGRARPEPRNGLGRSIVAGFGGSTRSSQSTYTVKRPADCFRGSCSRFSPHRSLLRC